jgi:3-hydroxyacyl-[acyl-carrier-protein] dehydratase
MGETGSLRSVDNALSLLPHREPFLLIDEIVYLEPGARAVGIKRVRSDEFWVPGHFPDRPTMPGVLIIEAMAQVGAVALLAGTGEGVWENPREAVEGGRMLPLFAGVDGVRFRRPVRPGDSLTLETELLGTWGNFGRARSTAQLTDGSPVAEAKLMFALGDLDGGDL